MRRKGATAKTVALFLCGIILAAIAIWLAVSPSIERRRALDKQDDLLDSVQRDDSADVMIIPAATGLTAIQWMASENALSKNLARSMYSIYGVISAPAEKYHGEKVAKFLVQVAVHLLLLLCLSKSQNIKARLLSITGILVII